MQSGNFCFPKKGSHENLELVIGVGEPYWVNGKMAACPIEYDGLFENMADIGGADLLQALHLASDVDPFLRKLSDKYDFYFLSGEAYFED